MRKHFIIIPIILISLISCEKERADIPYPYLISLPENYESHPDSSFSLLFYLHGAGGRGENLEGLKMIGIPKEIKEGREIPAIVISPQAPEDNSKFYSERLQTTLEYVMSNYRVDAKRIYATGLSMGGNGTWNWAVDFPGNFAAILPLCSHADPKDAPVISHIPIWAFHGELDDIYPLADTQELIDALKEAGGNPIFTIYGDLGHNIWDTTYADPAIYEWMFAQSQ